MPFTVPEVNAPPQFRVGLLLAGRDALPDDAVVQVYDHYVPLHDYLIAELVLKPGEPFQYPGPVGRSRSG